MPEKFDACSTGPPKATSRAPKAAQEMLQGNQAELAHAAYLVCLHLRGVEKALGSWSLGAFPKGGRSSRSSCAARAKETKCLGGWVGERLCEVSWDHVCRLLAVVAQFARAFSVLHR